MSPKAKRKTHEDPPSKTIYVQFPRKVDGEAKLELEELSDKIAKVRLPRQKKARFCYVDCASAEDVPVVEELLKTTKVCGYQLFVNSNRKIDDEEFKLKVIARTVEKRQAKAEAKRLKKELQRASISHKNTSNVNKLVVSNIPESADSTAVKELFPTCIEFAFREQPSRVAFVTFSNSREASGFIRKKPKIGDVELAVRPSIKVAANGRVTKKYKKVGKFVKKPGGK